MRKISPNSQTNLLSLEENWIVIRKKEKWVPIYNFSYEGRFLSSWWKCSIIASPLMMVLTGEKFAAPLECYGGALRHIRGRICPLHWLIWLRNWLSHLHSHKCLCILIRDAFDKKILSHIFFKVSLKSKHKI